MVELYITQRQGAPPSGSGPWCSMKDGGLPTISVGPVRPCRQLRCNVCLLKCKCRACKPVSMLMHCAHPRASCRALRCQSKGLKDPYRPAQNLDATVKTQGQHCEGLLHTFAMLNSSGEDATHFTHVPPLCCFEAVQSGLKVLRYSLVWAAC